MTALDDPVTLTIVRPPPPRECFEGDHAARRAAWRDYERCMWADAVEFRGLRLSAIEPLDRFAICEEVRRRNASR